MRTKPNSDKGARALEIAYGILLLALALMMLLGATIEGLAL